MAYTLDPFQVADQEYLAKHNYVSMLNMEPGAGKTVTSLFAHKDSGADVTLVVAPEPTHVSAWGKDAEEGIEQEVRVIGNRNKATKVATEDFLMGYPGIYITTPQFLTRADTDAWFGDLLVIDEGHMLNKYGGKGCETMLDLSSRFGGRLFLSGTAFRNNFERAWATGRFLWPELNRRGEVANKNYYLWLRERMTSEEVYTNQRDQWGKAKTATKWLVEAEPGRWVNELPAVITHKKREFCCKFHPEGFDATLEDPKRDIVKLSLDPKQKRIIKDLESQYLAWLDENPLVVELPMTMQQRIRQVTLGVPEVEDYTVLDDEGEEVEKQRLWFKPDSKSPFAEYLIDELQQYDDPAVVYLESQSFAEALVERLNREGITAFEYSGKTRSVRADNLKKFGTEYRVLVGVISAIGTGVDGLQKITNQEYWLERSVDETSNRQAESRLDRRGQKYQVKGKILVDDEGYAMGRLNKQLQKRLALNESLRRKV